MTKKKPVVKPVIVMNDDRKWQAEDDARTLMRAEEIKRDTARIKAAKAHAMKQMAELAKVVKK